MVEDNLFTDRNKPLAELHLHASGGASKQMLWKIAHQGGLKLDFKDYWAFKKHLTISETKNFDLIHKVCFEIDRIQSSPEAMEEIIYEEIAQAYIQDNVTTLELRYNPMLRNRGGDHDLDHLIMASLHGLDRALLAYPQVYAGIILMLDRRFSYDLNEIIIEKAIRYKNRGIVGIDLAGPRTEKIYDYKAYASLYKKAKEAGLGITIHTGEEGPLEEVWDVVNYIKPHRIGHGFNAHRDKKLMEKIVSDDIALEVCPTSNLRLDLIQDVSELKTIIRTLLDNKIAITINTDHTETYDINVGTELTMLAKHKILLDDELEEIRQRGHDRSFIRNSDFNKYYRTPNKEDVKIPRRGGVKGQ